MAIQAPNIWRNNFWQADLARIKVNEFACFLFQKEGKARRSVCSFESCMWIFRESGYREMIFGNQILARITANEFAYFYSRMKAGQRRVYVA